MGLSPSLRPEFFFFFFFFEQEMWVNKEGNQYKIVKLYIVIIFLGVFFFFFFFGIFNKFFLKYKEWNRYKKFIASPSS
jgi:hypothetical protein